LDCIPAEDHRKTTLKLALAAMIVASGYAGSKFFADIAKQGSYEFTSCYAGVATAIQFSNTNWGASIEHTGAILRRRVVGPRVQQGQAFDGRLEVRNPFR